MSRMLRVAAALLLLTAPACRDKPPPPGRPLTAAEREPFDDPLRLSCWPEPGSWPQFAHDPLHTGRSGVGLTSSDLELAWRFRPTTHRWSYEPGYAVWSCPVVGTVGRRPLVIAAYYDRNVYAVDAATGDKVWEFRPGEPVFASPVLGRIADRDMVFVASRNRSVYGLDATDGTQVWQFETRPWTFTGADCLMSSPTLVRDGNDAVLIVGAWNSDRSASRNVQSGELIVLDAADGTERRRQRLGSVPLTSPAVTRLDGELVVFVGTYNGIVHALRLADGGTHWESVLNEESHSSPSLAIIDDTAQVLVGTRLNSLFGLDARSGARRWRRDTGYWIDATPAWFEQPAAGAGDAATTTVVAGSYDWYVHGWSMGPEREHHWRAPTGNQAYASAAVATLAGEPVVVAMSWDQRLYLFDGGTGRTLWQIESGPLIWSHAYLGDSLWASPVVADVAGTPTVVFPALDGVLYAYTPRASAGATPAMRSQAPGGALSETGAD